MVAILACCAVVLVATAAEVLHAQRCRKVAVLAFGRNSRPALWVYRMRSRVEGDKRTVGDRRPSLTLPSVSWVRRSAV